MSGDADALSDLLAARVEDLVKCLLPAGRRDGAEWRCGSLSGEAGSSLAVHLRKPKAGIWADFASGEKGTALGLVAACLYGGRIAPAMSWAKQWLGISDLDVPASSRSAPVAGDRRIDDAALRRTAFAKALFLEAEPLIVKTPAGEYLKGRGIDLMEMRRQPKSLRFHPRLFNREIQRALPGMVAAVSGGAGGLQGVHRTFLARIDGRWQKAPLNDPKLTLGQISGGHVPIQRGCSGKSMRDAPPGEHLLVAEGIENALTVALAVPERRVIAALNVTNLGLLVLPPTISTVTIVADNDAPQSKATRALQRAIDRFIDEGRQVYVARSPEAGDFNDLLAAAP